MSNFLIVSVFFGKLCPCLFVVRFACDVDVYTTYARMELLHVVLYKLISCWFVGNFATSTIFSSYFSKIISQISADRASCCAVCWTRTTTVRRSLVSFTAASSCTDIGSEYGSCHASPDSSPPTCRYTFFQFQTDSFFLCLTRLIKNDDVQFHGFTLGVADILCLPEADKRRREAVEGSRTIGNQVGLGYGRSFRWYG